MSIEGGIHDCLSNNVMLRTFGYQALPVGLWSQLLSDVTQARAKTIKTIVMFFYLLF